MQGEVFRKCTFIGFACGFIINTSILEPHLHAGKAVVAKRGIGSKSIRAHGRASAASATQVHNIAPTATTARIKPFL